MPTEAVRLSAKAMRFVIYFLFVLTTIWFLTRVVGPASSRITHGYGAYYSASRLVLTGDYSEQVYEPDYFREVVRSDSDNQVEDIWPNPPTTTLLLLPIAGLPIVTARIVWTAANIFFLFAGLSLLVWTYAPQAPLFIWLFIFILAMLFRPVIANFIFGQAYILMFLLLAISVFAIERRLPVPGGVSLGAALAFKMIGWPLAILLVLLRRWRYLAILAGTLVVFVLVSLSITGRDSWTDFFDFLPRMLNSPFVCVSAYQTTRSWLCHLFAPQVIWLEVETLALPWVAQVILTASGLVTLILSLATARRQVAASAVALVVWGVLFAPLGEEYHQTVVLIPVVWLILAWWQGVLFSRVSLLFLGLALLLYILPFPLYHPRLEQGWLALLAYPRLYAAWLVWLVVILSAYKDDGRLWVTTG